MKASMARPKMKKIKIKIKRKIPVEIARQGDFLQFLSWDMDEKILLNKALHSFF